MRAGRVDELPVREYLRLEPAVVPSLGDRAPEAVDTL